MDTIIIPFISMPGNFLKTKETLGIRRSYVAADDSGSLSGLEIKFDFGNGWIPWNGSGKDKFKEKL
jgi:hypothetical protein